MIEGTALIREDFMASHLKSKLGVHDPEKATREQELEAEKALATQAMRQKGGGVDKATELVYSMKEDYGSGICNMMMIFNGSDNPITYDSFYGHKDSRPHKNKYDQRIEPGQWSVFLWVKGHRLHGACGSLFYNILGHQEKCLWQISVSNGMGENCRIWSQPWTATAIKKKHGHLTEMAMDSDHGLEQMTRDQGYIRTFGETSQGTSALMKFVITRSDIGYYD